MTRTPACHLFVWAMLLFLKNHSGHLLFLWCTMYPFLQLQHVSERCSFFCTNSTARGLKMWFVGIAVGMVMLSIEQLVVWIGVTLALVLEWWCCKWGKRDSLTLACHGSCCMHFGTLVFLSFNDLCENCIDVACCFASFSQICPLCNL